MARQTLLDEVLRIVQQDLLRPKHLWQVAIIVVALILGGLYAAWVRKRMKAKVDLASGKSNVPVDVLKFSIDGISRLAFPVSAMLLILAGGLAMRAAGLVQRAADVHLLRLALTLFGAMAAIRLFVYVLRRALPRSKWIGSFERAIAVTIWVLVALYLTGR